MPDVGKFCDYLLELRIVLSARAPFPYFFSSIREEFNFDESRTVIDKERGIHTIPFTFHS